MRILYLPNKFSQQRQKQKPVDVYPVLMAMEAEYYRNQGHEVFWDTGFSGQDKIVYEVEGLDFLKLPIPDRRFTNAFHKKYQRYGNYKYHPATHMQVADGCWWGKCIFCVERKKEYKIRNIDFIREEIDKCYLLGFKEIFDDSGTFPDGKWMTEFCIKMIHRNYKMNFGCNMRIGADVDWKLMKNAGFRMILFGVESANQNTLDKINKGVKVDKIVSTVKDACSAGLEPHIAVMFGYPWETEKEELNTLNLVHFLLRKGYAKTAQASLFDVKGMAPVDRGNINRIYEVAKYPEFWINKIKDIRRLEDFIYFLKSIRKGIVKD